MKKLTLAIAAAVGLAGGILVAQQGKFIPGTPGPTNVILTNTAHTAGDPCTVPSQVEINYVTQSVWICGGSVTAPFTYSKAK